MTTALSIITDAYREGNLIPVGSTPTDAEQAEALRALNRFISGVFGEEMGENLVDWPAPLPQRTAPVAANYPQLPYPMGLDGDLLGVPLPTSLSNDFSFYPPKNSRIVFGGVSATLYLPEQPDDGSRMAVVQGSGAGDDGTAGSILTLNGNGRTIEGANTLELTDPITPKQWLYRADLGDWIAVTTLAIGDELPFPDDLDDLWICMLAIRLSPRYGKAVQDGTSSTAVRMMKKLKAKYRQAGTTVYKSGDIPNTFQSYASNRWWW